jgi:NAD-dependent dihydropyrimidine dehydrogenase PreA subunit
MKEKIYNDLANHLFDLEMAFPRQEGLEEILKENFSPMEAEIALAFPNNDIPLQPVGVDDIMGNLSLPKEELVDILEKLSEKGLLFSGKTKDGEKGYALLQRGFGFPQTFFWKGERTPFAKKMADLVMKYYGGKKLVETFENDETKAYQFIPMNKTIEPEIQAVYPSTMMEQVIEQAEVIALAHCPCRMRAELLGKGCDHLLEVCLKFDDLAEDLIAKELARKITKGEAMDIIKKSEENGLVHFVDNALGDVKHNCNCCGCHCWALGPIKRREVPRDVIMATYFIRETDEAECTGCGSCVEVCPVDALRMDGDFPAVEEDWCVGCGLCVPECSCSAARLRKKSDKIPSHDFRELHERILSEREISKA